MLLTELQLHIPNVQILEQYWFWVLIATITAESWYIFLTDIHISNIISFAVKKKKKNLQNDIIESTKKYLQHTKGMLW